MDGSSVRRGAACVCAGAVVAIASGCGTAADADQVRAATERFYAAVAEGDGRGACAELSPAIRSQLVADQSKPTCAEAVLELTLRGHRAGTVWVYATSAEVQLRGGDTVFLGDTARGWRIDAVGCRPQGPGPYDCEEQA